MRVTHFMQSANQARAHSEAEFDYAAPGLEVREIIDRESLEVAFQPIVDIESREVFAYECFARPTGSKYVDVPEMYQAAMDQGLIGELGRLQRKIAMRSAPDLPLFVNIHPAEFDHGWLVRPDEPIFLHRPGIYLEITESAPLSYFEQCHAVLLELRKKGLKLVIDDFGAGFSNLKYISELSPDIVKLDRNLIVGILPNSREHRLLASIVSLCKVMDAKVVAEGIESEREFNVVRRAGANYGQGYLIGAPIIF